jgi:hypothetical protein
MVTKLDIVICSSELCSDFETVNMNTFEILDLSSRREGASKSPLRQQLCSLSSE